MVFSTASFLFYFLPLFLICYVIFPFRNATALIFSTFFYIWGEGTFVLVLFLSVVVNFICGLFLDKASEKKKKKQYLIYGILVNLAILFYFKYFGFVLLDILRVEGLTKKDIPHLPLGISFFTFQSISYLVDVYRGDAKKAESIWDLALYIMLFPQLIAGPIVRYSTVARQIRRRVIHFSFIRHGIHLFAIGLAQKILIANNMGSVADDIFSLTLDSLTTQLSWLGTIAYTLQIYFDFAGYSYMAIGLGIILGFKFPRNFNYPYISQSITEFWQRWHISLSSWFRDYVYIPLGGNRNGAISTYKNLFLVFLLCGLWHGAAWTYVFWGMFHGLILVIERLGLNKILNSVPRIVRHSYCLLLVMMGWVFFRSESVGQAVEIIKAMFGFSMSSIHNHSIYEHINNQQLLFMLIGFITATPFLKQINKMLAIFEQQKVNRNNSNGNSFQIVLSLTVSVFLLFLSAVYIAAGTYNPFLYFRF